MSCARSPLCTDWTSRTTSAEAPVDAAGAPATRNTTHTTARAAAAPSARWRWAAAAAVTRSSASAGTNSRPMSRAVMAMTAMFALARPMPSRRVSIPIPT